MPPLDPPTTVDKVMSKPHPNEEFSGQYNDEYLDDAHEKMRRRHYTPHRHVAWSSTPIVNNLPGSCDDEYYDGPFFTSVDLSMVRNASANALVALASKTFDEVVPVTEENCLRVGHFVIHRHRAIVSIYCSRSESNLDFLLFF